jgi:hypothetical protein
MFAQPKGLNQVANQADALLEGLLLSKTCPYPSNCGFLSGQSARIFQKILSTPQNSGLLKTKSRSVKAGAPD